MAHQTIDRAARNAELLRAGYAAFARGDLMAVQELFGPDATWHVQRLGQLGGDHRGWPAILAFFGRSMELTQGTFSVVPIEVFTNETGGAVVVRSTGQRGGAVLDDRQVHLFHLDGDRVSEIWQFVGDSAATEAFWA